jgi:hypothetical protein
LKGRKAYILASGYMKSMETEKVQPVKMNLSISPSVAAALRKFAFETTGHMRGVSDVAEKAIRDYLEKNGVRVEGQA